MLQLQKMVATIQPTDAETARILRERMGLSQRQAAHIAKIHRVTVGQAEAGRASSIVTRLYLKIMEEHYANRPAEEIKSDDQRIAV